jgi:hypothetical protein
MRGGAATVGGACERAGAAFGALALGSDVGAGWYAGAVAFGATVIEGA